MSEVPLYAQLPVEAIKRLRWLLSPFRLTVFGVSRFLQGCKGNKTHRFENGGTNQLRETQKREVEEGTTITAITLKVPGVRDLNLLQCQPAFFCSSQPPQKLSTLEYERDNYRKRSSKPHAVRTGSWMGPPQGERAPRVGPIVILARE